jgi:hypothetical protein
MKKILKLWAITLFITIPNYAQTVMKIGNNLNSINISAVLELESKTKGFLTPRMTSSQINSISNPANGLMVFCTNCGINGELRIYNSSSWSSLVGSTSSLSTLPQIVYNAATGKFWMDRNLGAISVAASSTDPNGYGDLYQWGRSRDGHQLRASSISTTTLPSYDYFSSNFITNNTTFDWLSTQNNNLWQGVNGLNNPCPIGFRIPTLLEWQNEMASWSQSNSIGAYSSPLKLTLGGIRTYSTGIMSQVNVVGYYWSSSIFSSTLSYGISFTSSTVINNSQDYKASARSIRCIKD